jgi:hypothetical protein
VLKVPCNLKAQSNGHLQLLCKARGPYVLQLCKHTFSPRGAQAAISCCASTPAGVSPCQSSRLTALPTHTTSIRIPLLPDIDLGARARIRPRAVNKALLDIACEAVKCLIDVNVALSRDLEEGDAELVSKRLALFCRDGALFFPVALVADEDLVDTFGGVLLDVGEPCADV